jgi:hypothetical protein
MRSEIYYAGERAARVYRVFRVPTSQALKVEALLTDDLVSRQSITRRDAKTLGLPDEGLLVLVEGSQAGVERASALLADVPALEGAAADEVYRRLKLEEEDAASGLGLVFGG